MFSRGDNSAGDSGDASLMSTTYPTQWALNPSAYQHMDSSSVDWAALAQQWIQMKDSVMPVTAVPPDPPKPPKATVLEDTSDAMDIEELEASDNTTTPSVPWSGVGAAPADWDNGAGWNQWGWGWGGTGGAKTDAIAPIPLMPYPTTDIAGYTTNAMAAASYETGYWTAPVDDQPGLQEAPPRKNYETNKNNSRRKRSRDRPSLHKSGPVLMPPQTATAQTLDAAKRKQLPAWIREGLEKMEREKARMAEREAEAAEEERLKRETELREMEKIQQGTTVNHAASKFDSESEEEAVEKRWEGAVDKSEEEEPAREPPERAEEPPQPPVQLSREEILQEIMLTVRRTLTEILLEVTDQEIHSISQEELMRYNAAQASRLNAVGKSKALSAITSGLGLGAYGSSDSESGSEDEDETTDITDYQLQEIIRKRRAEFEKTSRLIEAELLAAEAREGAEDNKQGQGEASNGEKHRSSTPAPSHTVSRHSATPPAVRAPSENLSPSHKHILKDNSPKKSQKNSKKALETIHEKPKKSKRLMSPNEDGSRTPSDTSEESDTSDSSDDSSSDSESSDSSSSNSKRKLKKQKRQSSSESESRRKSSKKLKKEKYSSDKNSYEKSSRKLKDSKAPSKDKRSKSSRDREKYAKKSHKHDAEHSKKKDDYNYEKSSKRDRESRSRRDEEYDKYRRDDDYDRHRRDSRHKYDYEKSRSKYREEEDKQRKHCRSSSISYRSRSRSGERSGSEWRRRREKRRSPSRTRSHRR